jgi:hypothetical protein
MGKKVEAAPRPHHIETPQIEPVERRETISYQLSLFGPERKAA